MNHNMLHAATNQWISYRVLFEVGSSGLIEPSGRRVYQGALLYCRFGEEAMNQPPYDPRMVSALEALGHLSEPCSGPDDCEERLRSAGLSPDGFSCSNVGASRYEPAALAFFMGATDKIFFPLMESSPEMLAALFALVTFLTLEEIIQMAMQGRAYFALVSKYVELLTLVDVFLIFERAMAQQAATPQDGASWELYSNNIELLQRLCGIACFTWWMRMLNFVSKLHPRMRILMHTMSSAWLDLVFFCILFAIVLFSFSTTFHIWFAGSEAEFRTLGRTFVSLFRGLTGDITAGPLVARWDTGLFYMAYVVLSMLIMVNVFIAIISSSFEGQQQEVETLIERRARQALELDGWILQDPGGSSLDGQDEAPRSGDVLKVVLWRGRSLRQSDWFGLSNPYATLGLRASGEERQEPKGPETIRLQLGDRPVAFEAARVQSQVVEQSVDPEWNQRGLFSIPHGAAETGQLELLITVSDKDAAVDDLMGEAAAPVSQLLQASDACKSVSVSWGRSMVCRYVCPSGGKGDKVFRHLLKVYRDGAQAGVVEVSVVLHSARDTDEASAQAVSL
ncbi:unnamed protein product [Prorocentrum cordatum]|uniref:C2 domain-containing protein n=1 Tax=Prorocentrum cordatum TaxID=2364126 RepID=A0ABN9PTA0_9DINO|nr:unnamed protein product [Polarella glacialis]